MKYNEDTLLVLLNGQFTRTSSSIFVMYQIYLMDNILEDIYSEKITLCASRVIVPW